MISVWKCDVEVDATGVVVPEFGAELTAESAPGGRGECIPVLVLRVAIYTQKAPQSNHQLPLPTTLPRSSCPQQASHSTHIDTLLLIRDHTEHIIPPSVTSISFLSNTFQIRLVCYSDWFFDASFAES